jgi:hypothetical protein
MTSVNVRIAAHVDFERSEDEDEKYGRPQAEVTHARTSGTHFCVTSAYGCRGVSTEKLTTMTPRCLD